MIVKIIGLLILIFIFVSFYFYILKFKKRENDIMLNEFIEFVKSLGVERIVEKLSANEVSVCLFANTRLANFEALLNETFKLKYSATIIQDKILLEGKMGIKLWINLENEIENANVFFVVDAINSTREELKNYAELDIPIHFIIDDDRRTIDYLNTVLRKYRFGYFYILKLEALQILKKTIEAISDKLVGFYLTSSDDKNASLIQNLSKKDLVILDFADNKNLFSGKTKYFDKENIFIIDEFDNLIDITNKLESASEKALNTKKLVIFGKAGSKYLASTVKANIDKFNKARIKFSNF